MEKNIVISVSFLRAPRRRHRPRGERRRPPGRPGPPAPGPELPGPTLRWPVSAALGSRQRPPGGRGVPRGEGRRRGRPQRLHPWGAQRSPPVTEPRAPLRRCWGETPLHMAAFWGHVECAQLLLAAKASVEIKDTRGWGPQPMSRFWRPFFFTGITDITINNRYNRCSSTNVACLNDLWHIF